jgi:hypothetical protein
VGFSDEISNPLTKALNGLSSLYQIVTDKNSCELNLEICKKVFELVPGGSAS